MKLLILAGFLIVAALLLLFVIWLTGGSVIAIVAGVIFLLLAGIFVAEGTGVLTIPASASSIFATVMALCFVIILVMTIWAFWNASKEREKLDAKNMANPTLCKNDDGDWVKIPAGQHKDRDGSCVEGTPPPAPTVVQEKERKLIKSCTSGESDCKITSGSGMTFTSSASRVIVKFTDPESGKKSEILFGDFVKDLAKFQKQTELVFDTTKGAQPDVVKIYQNY